MLNEDQGSDEKSKVLIVEDDPDFRSIVEEWISPHYDYIGLPDGEDLTQELENFYPDLVILDVRLPGSDGFKLCNRIRSDRRFGSLPILFLTACKEDEDFVKNLNVGGTAYLTKPIGRKRLLAMLRELLPHQASWKL